MKNFVLTVTVLAFCSLSLAENLSATRDNNQPETAVASTQGNAAQAAPNGAAARPVCAFNFTSGHDETFFKYCVTANGNIVQLETPRGREHLNVADKIGEGYGLCDQGGEYFDYAEFGESGNWNAASVVSQDTQSVKIARTTRDGIWTFTQTITQVAAGSPSANVAMAITNNTDTQRDVIIFRYANVNADGIAKNNLDSTVDAAFAWNSFSRPPQVGFGLMLQNVGSTPFHHTGFMLNVPNPPEPCNAFVHAPKHLITNTDGSIVVDYALGIGSHETRTVTVAYKGM
jgi:hypothetical protein